MLPSGGPWAGGNDVTRTVWGGNAGLRGGACGALRPCAAVGSRRQRRSRERAACGRRRSRPYWKGMQKGPRYRGPFRV